MRPAKAARILLGLKDLRNFVIHVMGGSLRLRGLIFGEFSESSNLEFTL